VARSDITKHELVPKHELLSEKETKDILKELNIVKGQLPKILVTDPVVKKLKADAGVVMRITRNSRTAGTSIFYRVVVAE